MRPVAIATTRPLARSAALSWSSATRAPRCSTPFRSPKAPIGKNGSEAANRRVEAGGTNMKDEYARQPLAGWFIWAAIASLLFMALGCATYVMHVLADPAAMPL